MEQTAPKFILNKYRSILRSILVVEIVTYIFSLTDAVIAGNVVGEEGMAAVGLVWPLILMAQFLAVAVNGGTTLNYTQAVGRFDKDRAQEFFAQGISLALALGMAILLTMFLVRDAFVEWLGVSGHMAGTFVAYYNVIVFYCMLRPFTHLLESMVIADGGEKLAAGANVLSIIGNVVLSFWLAMRWGVSGIAWATLACDVLFIAIVGSWFFTSKCGLRIGWRWSLEDCRQIFRSGIVRASARAMVAVTMGILNAFVMQRFGEAEIVMLTVAANVVAMSHVFHGFPSSAQPLVGTLRGEGNRKAIRALLRTVSGDVLKAGLLISAAVVAFAPLFVRAFGIGGGDVYAPCVEAVRIVGATVFCHALLDLFIRYYIMIGQNGTAFFACFCKELATPLGLVLPLAALTGRAESIWIGFALAAVLAIFIAAAAVYWRHGKELFPFLLPTDGDDKVFIYDFDATKENAVAMYEKAMEVLKAHGYSKNNQVLAGIVIEDLVLLIREKNPNARQPILVEFTMILEEETIRLIFRDSGVIFNLTDINAEVESIRQYFVASITDSMTDNAHLMTTGYNRNVIAIPAEKAA